MSPYHLNTGKKNVFFMFSGVFKALNVWMDLGQIGSQYSHVPSHTAYYIYSLRVQIIKFYIIQCGLFFFLLKIVEGNIASICVLSDNKTIIFGVLYETAKVWDVIRVNFDIRWKFNICSKPQRSHNVWPIQIWQGCLNLNSVLVCLFTNCFILLLFLEQYFRNSCPVN